MAGNLDKYLSFSVKNTHHVTTITSLSKKDIPLPIGFIATNGDYTTWYTTLLTYTAWGFRLIEWSFIMLFSVVLTGTHTTVIFIYISIIIALFIEFIINFIGFKTLQSLKEERVTDLFDHYNSIDGDIDEKAYNSDICVQKYFQRRKTSSIKKLLNVSDGDVVLDIGCGSGVQLKSLDAKSQKILIGTDISHNALQYAKNKNIPNTEFIQCNAEYLPFKINTIDKIICAELIEHLPNPEYMLNESKRVLKDNGSIVITTPNEISIWGIYEILWDMFGRGRNYGETHLKFFSIEDLNKYFSSFAIKSANTIFFISPFIALLNNKTLLKLSKSFDTWFEKHNCGVSIIYYAKKK